MKMMFPRISHLIGEQMLIHSVSDLYMTVCTCNNHNVFRVYLRHHLYRGIAFAEKMPPKRMILDCFSA